MVSLSLPILLFLSGPDGVKIENAEGAVATVTGLQVGTYEFTLTVTDDRDLRSSDTVSVIVREGVFASPASPQTHFILCHPNQWLQLDVLCLCWA